MIDGDDLKAMRLNAGISQQSMSKKLDCDRRTIHNYELGVSDIPSARLFQWFKYCKLDISVLLNQIKAVRGEASRNGTAKLLDIISVILILSPLWSNSIITPIYLCLLAICAIYGAYKRDINILHISGFIFIPTAISSLIFETGLINYLTPAENAPLQSVLIYGTQLFFITTIVLLLIFRVQTSRLLTNQENIKLTNFDGIFHWIYIYNSLLYLAALLEDMVYIFLDMKSWTLIYDNFEGLVYIAWTLSCCTLISMMLTTEKVKKSK